jgi:hypothetical protein
MASHRDKIYFDTNDPYHYYDFFNEFNGIVFDTYADMITAIDPKIERVILYVFDRIHGFFIKKNERLGNDCTSGKSMPIILYLHTTSRGRVIQKKFNFKNHVKCFGID